MFVKDQGQEIPEEFYNKRWVRFYADQRVKPAPLNLGVSSRQSSVEGAPSELINNRSSIEELKHDTSRSMILASQNFPTPTEEMLFKVTSSSGVAQVEGLTFRLDQDFKAGTYQLVCKDVTPGLPPRMQMKHTRVLLKLVDLDPPPEEEKVEAAAKPKGKKK